jgi:hypothetical protein
VPTQAQIVEALRADAEFMAGVDSFLMVSLVLAHGRQQEARGVPFATWLDHIEALLGEYI